MYYRFLILIMAASIGSYAQNDTSVTQTTNPAAQVPAEKKGEVYKLCLGADIPVTAVCTGWSLFAFTKIYSKEASTELQIRNLDRADIPYVDRWAAGMSDETADANSDYLFYGTIPVPFALLLDKPIRHDALKIGFLYLEAMSITGLF